MTTNILISCSNKKSLVNFCINFLKKKANIYASSGTFNYLNNSLQKNSMYSNDLPLNNLNNLNNLLNTKNLLNGKIKTLHPNIYGGIMANRESSIDMNDIDTHNIKLFDIICVNLYPFEKVLKHIDLNKDVSNIDTNPFLSNIDIGGHTLIRAACKNYKYVLPIVDPNDYDFIIENYHNFTINDRKKFAAKAFDYITTYDMMISDYFNHDNNIFYRKYTKKMDLKYGNNPTQKAGIATIDYPKQPNKYPFDIINGCPSYINILDAVYSWNCVTDIGKQLNCTVSASYKHNSPAGISTCEQMSKKLYEVYTFQNSNDVEIPVCSDTYTAVIRSRNSDPMSSFGDFIAVNNVVDEQTALYLKKEVSDSIIKLNYNKYALNILKKKKKGKYIILKGNIQPHKSLVEFKELNNMALFQDTNTFKFPEDKISYIKDESLCRDIKLGTIALKYIPSNSVTITTNGQVIAIGCGQQNRLDCITLAGKKALNWQMRQTNELLAFQHRFLPNISNTNKINAIMKYLKNNFTRGDRTKWLTHFCKWIEYDFLVLNEKTKLGMLTNYPKFVLSSDGFLPFEDNVEEAHLYNIGTIVQPGGSIKDDKIKKECEIKNIDLILTGERLFYH